MKRTRRLVQSVFLVITLAGVYLIGGNAERWCPFGGVESLYTYLHEGNMPCSLAISNFYILAALLILTIVCRRAFCGYMCPIGTISEWLHVGAKRGKIETLSVPQPIEHGLAALKYVVLGSILWLTYRSGELIFRGFDPCYALISKHGEDITFWAYAVTGSIIIGSLFISMPFCRWLCPLAAVLNPLSRFGVTRIRRDHGTCTSCGQCAKVCPMAIPVDRVAEVTQARCMSCMDCLAACPKRSEKTLVWGVPKILGSQWRPGVVVLLIGTVVATCVVGDYAFPMPSFVKKRAIPPAQIATVELLVENLSCRGRSNLLWYYLNRSDELELGGYLKAEAWPGPGQARVVISYDPTQNDVDLIRQAITEPYFDSVANVWRLSPFQIAGYDPLGKRK